MMKEYKKNPVLLFAMYALMNSALAAYGPYLNLRYKAQGIGMNFIGILATIAPFISILVAPFWGKTIDKSGNRRKYLVILIIGSIVAISFYPFANGVSHFVIINLILAIFQTSISATVESLTLGMVERNGHNYSKIRIGGTIGYSAVLLLLGTIFSKSFNLGVMFAILSYIAMIVCILALPKKETVLPPTIIDKKKGDKLFADKKIFIVLAMLMFSFMAHGFNASYISLYLEEMDKLSILNIILFIGTSSEFPILLMIQRIMNRFSTMGLLMFSGYVSVVRLLLVATGILPLIIIGQLIQGLSYMLCFYCGTMLVYQLVPNNMKSQGQSAIAVAQGGLGSILGNMVGGKLVDLFGFKAAYLVIAAIVFVITTISFVIYKRGFDIETKSPTIS